MSWLGLGPKITIVDGRGKMMRSMTVVANEKRRRRRGLPRIMTLGLAWFLCSACCAILYGIMWLNRDALKPKNDPRMPPAITQTATPKR
jgi:hypothetical protein